MALTYLVDTNIVSEIIRPKPSPRVKHKWAIYRAQIAISSITWHELLYGLERLPQSERKRGIHDFLFNFIQPVFPIMPYDDVAAEWYARERARLTKAGLPPTYADGQIAAIAAVNHLVLVTRNSADFHPYNLHIENWYRK